MRKIELSNATKRHIAKSFNMPFRDFIRKDAEEIDELIVSKSGKKLKPQLQKEPYLINRGSVYFFLARLFQINIKKLDRIISKI